MIMVILGIGAFFLMGASNEKVFAVVSLDVNPSLQFSINKKSEIIKSDDFSNEIKIDLDIYDGWLINDAIKDIMIVFESKEITAVNDPIIISFVELESDKNNNREIIRNLIKEQNIKSQVVFINGDINKLNSSNDDSKTLGRKVIENMLIKKSKNIKSNSDFIRNSIKELVDEEISTDILININADDYDIKMIEIDDNLTDDIFEKQEDSNKTNNKISVSKKNNGYIKKEQQITDKKNTNENIESDKTLKLIESNKNDTENNGKKSIKLDNEDDAIKVSQNSINENSEQFNIGVELLNSKDKNVKDTEKDEKENIKDTEKDEKNNIKDVEKDDKEDIKDTEKDDKEDIKDTEKDEKDDIKDVEKDEKIVKDKDKDK
jgi:hypothetical protein